MNKFKVGVNFSYDRYVERVDNINYNRIDKSIGTFFEYTYNNNSDISFSGGLRFDNHNQIGSFITPRIHFRYNPLENFVLLNEPPITIICGNSDKMIGIVRDKLDELYDTQGIGWQLWNHNTYKIL